MYKLFDHYFMKKLDANKNNYWKQNRTKQIVYSNLPPISQYIQHKQDILVTAREVRTNS